MFFLYCSQVIKTHGGIEHRVFCLRTEAVAIVHRFHSGYDLFRTDSQLSDIDELRYQSGKFIFGKAGIFVKAVIRSNIKCNIESGG